jgi:hypothetical protein
MYRPRLGESRGCAPVGRGRVHSEAPVEPHPRTGHDQRALEPQGFAAHLRSGPLRHLDQPVTRLARPSGAIKAGAPAPRCPVAPAQEHHWMESYPPLAAPTLAAGVESRSATEHQEGITRNKHEITGEKQLACRALEVSTVQHADPAAWRAGSYPRTFPNGREVKPSRVSQRDFA